MAEIVGLVSGIVALIQLAGKLTSISYSYACGVKRASKDLGDLIDELGSLSKVLLSLRSHLERVKTTSSISALQGLNDSDGPLKVCGRELEELISQVEPRNGWKGMVDSIKWPLKEKDTLQLISRIERHKSLIVFALAADQMSTSREIEKHVQNIQIDIKEVREDILTEFAAQDAWRHKWDLVASKCLQFEDCNTSEKRANVLNWVCSDNVDTKHNDVSNRMQEGTGQWLLRELKFQEWYTGVLETKMLWGYGIPGAGKTFISAAVFNYLEEQSSALNYGVAHIYFDYKEREQQRPENVVSSLVKQFARRIPYLPAVLEEMHGKFKNHQLKGPTLEELYPVLITIARLFSRSYIIFDAFDECDEKQRKGLLPLLLRMEKDGINLFLTSRPHPEDIQEYFANGSLKIEIYAHEEDIRRYVENRIEENSRAKRLIKQGKCQERIVTDLLDCAKGMFLLVHFHIEFLCQQTTAKKILLELGRIKDSSSRGLDPTYDRAMENLRGQAKCCEEMALKALLWLVKARRTLTVDEIRVAISIEDDRYELDELDLPDIATLLDICAGLVIIDEDTNTIRLAHYTVQEYLLKKNVFQEDADLYLAKTCATYLLFDAFTTWSSCETYRDAVERLETHPFQAYVVSHCLHHLKACPEEYTVDVVLKFIKHDCARRAYLQLYEIVRDNIPAVSQYWGWIDLIQSPLHVACILGHRLAALRLIDAGADIYALDSWGGTALHKAALGGHGDVVDLLLENGVDVSCQDYHAKTALHTAVSQNHSEAVLRLIKGGASVLIPDHWGWTPIYMAVCKGNVEMILLLITHGADLNVHDLEGQTLLHRAAYRGRLEVVRALIEKGVPILDQSRAKWTALHYAAIQGHQAVVKLLLEKGADHSTQDEDGQTALHKAVISGSEATVRLLLEKGACPSVQDQDGETALHEVAEDGGEAVGILRLLLEKGADVSLKDIKGETALHRAVNHRNLIAARLLIDRGASISTQSHIGWTALHLAASTGSIDMVQLLLNCDADYSRCDNEGRTALHIAVLRDHCDVVRLLLKTGAAPGIRDVRGETPLHIAVTQESKDIVELLLGVSPIRLVNKNGESVLDKVKAKDIFKMVVAEVERRAMRRYTYRTRVC